MIEYKKFTVINNGIQKVSQEAFSYPYHAFTGGYDYYAQIKDEIVGYCTGSIYTPEEIKVDLPYDKIGWFGQCAVLKAHSGKGIASEFYRLRIKSLEDKVPAIAMSAWRRSDNGDINIKSIAEKFGFEAKYEINDKWLQLSRDDPNYYCDSCGDGDCHCSAVIYVRVS